MATTDISGYAVFSEGDLGRAHVLAHELLDTGRHVEGRRLLGSRLDGRDGAGSEWTHVQWHMAVFELAAGLRRSPLERFRTHILPAAASGDALTDAPSLLWRLELAGVVLQDSDREPVREAALAHLRQDDDPYVELHNLLALGAARDIAGLDRWIDAPGASEDLPGYDIVRAFARGLRSFAVGDYLSAETALGLGARAISWLGGSNGQNQLFAQLRDEAARRGDDRAVAVGTVPVTAGA